MTPPRLTQKLLKWFDHQGRHHLPWREQINPYRVWISEIMLQQTQVSTVIPYFERFMQKFPSLKQLAEAEEDAVLHLWTGLGYYSRARNLHKTAQIITQDYQGQFPNNLEQLEALPGIGRSTAGAIMAIGFNKKAPILDGNVKRVLARYHAIEGWPNAPMVSKQLWSLASTHTSSTQPADYTQAIMDLGATVCTRQQPKCVLCPLKLDCKAHQEERETDFPTPKPKKILNTRASYFILIRNLLGQILLEKRPPSGIWGSLWSLPECSPDTHIQTWCRQFYPSEILNITHLPSFRHTFSHFHLHITPVLIEMKDQLPETLSHPSGAPSPTSERGNLARISLQETSERIWYNPNNPQDLGLPGPVKKMLLALSSKESTCHV